MKLAMLTKSSKLEAKFIDQQIRAVLKTRPLILAKKTRFCNSRRPSEAQLARNEREYELEVCSCKESKAKMTTCVLNMQLLVCCLTLAFVHRAAS